MLDQYNGSFEEQDIHKLPNQSPVVESGTIPSHGAADVPAGGEAPTAEAENLARPEQPSHGRHVDAGRKGGRRVHQLMQEGRLYEQEHGLKKGRQRLSQLVALGRLYEQERGLTANAQKPRVRLSRKDREELVATLFECLYRLAKPSFRRELDRYVPSQTMNESAA